MGKRKEKKQLSLEEQLQLVKKVDKWERIISQYNEILKGSFEDIEIFITYQPPINNTIKVKRKNYGLKVNIGKENLEFPEWNRLYNVALRRFKENELEEKENLLHYVRSIL